MNQLSDQLLVKSYIMAVQLGLEYDFILLLENELVKRQIVFREPSSKLMGNCERVLNYE